MPTRWNRSSALTAAALITIVATVMLGMVIGHFIGTAKSFFLIVVAMLGWLVAGWFFGGLRPILVGLTALAAALMASEAAYAPAFIFSCAAVLVFVADIQPKVHDRISA